MHFINRVASGVKVVRESVAVVAQHVNKAPLRALDLGPICSVCDRQDLHAPEVI